MKKLIILLLLLQTIGLGQTFAQASLWVLNPQNNWYWRQGRIENATVAIRPAGTYFEVGLYLTISSAGTSFSGDIQLESVLNFNLPPGSHVLDSWLWVGEDIIQGKIIDKWTASNIYEGIVNRRRDPSILKKMGTDQYELRVYPMKPGETRKVKITYLVPSIWNSGKASVPLPTHILKASNQIPALYTLVWTDEGWEVPDIPEISDDVFISYQDVEFGSYLRYDIPNSLAGSSLSFRMNAPLTNGLFLTIGEDKDESGVYQLAVDFSQFLDNEESSKLAILVDYEGSNTQISREQIFSTLEQYLLDHYTEKDSFNLFYSRYEIAMYSDNWVPVTKTELAAALQPLKDGFLTLYSNLPGLLVRGNSFLNDNSGGQLVLYSNADNFGTQEKANNLVKDIKEMDLAPLHIADFQNEQFSNHRIGNRWYNGQEYLFINLSRITGGVYEKLNSHINLDALCSSVFGSLNGAISAFDLYSTATGGFCYARFNQKESEIYHLGEYFVQTGRFIGGAPFSFILTGIYNSEPFNQLIVVEDDQIFYGDSLIRKAWYGHHILELETGQQNNEKVTQILSESIDNRVLSKYTAFLCLEPSDSVAVCLSCMDESRLTWINDMLNVRSELLKLFPNPCVDFLNITFDVSSDWDQEDVKIQVFSIMGKLVHEIRPEIIPGQENSVEWNLATSDGARVSSGQYLVVLSCDHESYKQSLIIQ